MPTRKKEPEGIAFEEAMERLETIVAGMESEKMPLKDLVTNYERGIALLKICQSRIADAQKRIELIAKESGSDDFVLTGFDAEGGAGADGDEQIESIEEEDDEEEESDEVRLL